MVSKTSNSKCTFNTATEERAAQRLVKFRIKAIVLANDAPNESGDFDLERCVLCTSFSIVFKPKKISTEMQTSQSCVSHTSICV